MPADKCVTAAATASISAVATGTTRDGATAGMRRLLPLPLTAFERYMLADDRPTHPMEFQIRLIFSGPLLPEALAQAVAVAAERHPLLRAHLSADARGRPIWIEAEAQPLFHGSPWGTPWRLPQGRHIDLRKECGVRVWARYDNSQTELRLMFHHACCDGIGAYQFVEDLLTAYHHACTAQAEPRLRHLQPERLPARGKFGLNAWRLLARLPAEAWALVVGSATFFLLRPAPLALPPPKAPVPAGTTAQSEADELACLTDMPAHTFEPAASRRLLAAAKTAGCTFNDLLLRDLYLALHAWNREHGRQGGTLLRLMVPINLRAAADETLPAANVVAMAHVDRRPHWFSRRWLLRTIRWELAFIKRFRLSLAFHRATALLVRLPWGLRLLTSSRRCFATAVLSNVGRLFAETSLPRDGSRLLCGNLRLDRVESAPPVRPRTPLAISTLWYADRLTVVFNYDRLALRQADAEALLALYISQLGRTIEEGQ